MEEKPSRYNSFRVMQNSWWNGLTCATVKGRMEIGMIRKIGVISDTHIPHFKKLPEAIWEQFGEVELIIHAGDLSVLSVIAELETIAPVVAVQGNVEHEEVMLELPIKREVVVGHCRIGIVHILGDSHNRVHVAHQEFPNAHCVVFGHSHIPYNQEHEGQLLFNPGSATDRRRQPRCSIGLLYVDDEEQNVRGEIIWL
jgi:putative phosphoesterase